MKQTSSIRAYVKEFTTLTLKIPNITDENMFHFIDGLQSLAKTELERQHVNIIGEAITQAKALADIRHDQYDKSIVKETE